MSGFVERVIEDWLTKADERSYQIPFVAVLARSGHSIKNVSRHSALEHGKDITTVAPDGAIHAYQLKAGAIGSKAKWREIRDEVREATMVPLDIPGMPTKTPNKAFLVLTGHISDSVRNEISLSNTDLESRGYAQIQTIELPQLVSDFARIFENFCPNAIGPLNDLVRLYLTDGHGPQDKAKLHSLLQEIAGTPRTRRQIERALSNLVVAAEFLSAPFRKSENWTSLIDTWVITACVVLRLLRSLGNPRISLLSLDLCRTATEEAADALTVETMHRKDFLEGDVLLDSYFVACRKLVTLGYVSARLNAKCIAGESVITESERLLEVALRPPALGAWGESGWNYRLNLALALRHSVAGQQAGEAISANWLTYVCPSRGAWPKDPYWSLEEAVSLSSVSDEAPNDSGERVHLSYTARSALDFLARSLRRRTLAPLWPAVSRFNQATFRPDEPWQLLDWHVNGGQLELAVPPYRASWEQLRRLAYQARDSLFSDYVWLLPYFLCTYAHRTSTSLSGELDYQTAPEELKRTWTT